MWNVEKKVRMNMKHTKIGKLFYGLGLMLVNYSMEKPVEIEKQSMYNICPKDIYKVISEVENTKACRASLFYLTMPLLLDMEYGHQNYELIKKNLKDIYTEYELLHNDYKEKISKDNVKSQLPMLLKDAIIVDAQNALLSVDLRLFKNIKSIANKNFRPVVLWNNLPHLQKKNQNYENHKEIEQITHYTYKFLQDNLAINSAIHYICNLEIHDSVASYNILDEILKVLTIYKDVLLNSTNYKTNMFWGIKTEDVNLLINDMEKPITTLQHLINMGLRSEIKEHIFANIVSQLKSSETQFHKITLVLLITILAKIIKTPIVIMTPYILRMIEKNRDEEINSFKDVINFYRQENHLSNLTQGTNIHHALSLPEINQIIKKHLEILEDISDPNSSTSKYKTKLINDLTKEAGKNLLHRKNKLLETLTLVPDMYIPIICYNAKANCACLIYLQPNTLHKIHGLLTPKIKMEIISILLGNSCTSLATKDKELIEYFEYLVTMRIMYSWQIIKMHNMTIKDMMKLELGYTSLENAIKVIKEKNFHFDEKNESGLLGLLERDLVYNKKIQVENNKILHLAIESYDSKKDATIISEVCGDEYTGTHYVLNNKISNPLENILSNATLFNTEKK